MEYVLLYELEVLPDYNGFKDCIYKINIEYKAIDGEYTTSDYSSMTLPFPQEGAFFIPFEDLTDLDIRDWIFRLYPKNFIEQNLADRIFIMKNPPIKKQLLNNI